MSALYCRNKQRGLHTEPKLFADYFISQSTETFSVTNCLLFHPVSQSRKYFARPVSRNSITNVQG